MRRIVAVLALLAGAVPMFAQLPQAEALFQQGKYDEAQRLVAPLAGDAPALALMGRIALAKNDTDKAVDYLEKAVAKNDRSASFHYWLGNAYGQQAMVAGMLKGAMLAGKTRDQLERAVQLDPNLLEARFGLIDFYVVAPSMLGGSEDKAMQQAAEIKRRDSFSGHRAYARIYGRQKKMDLARKEYLDAVREQPRSAAAHAFLGAFFGVNDKNVKGGFDELETAVKLDPAYMITYFRLGQLAAISGTNLPRGEEALKKYITIQPKETDPSLGSAYYCLGQIYEKQGKKAEARAHYAIAVRYAPSQKTYQDALKRMT
jgi:tetratricopeptide (TPR) repeat protein